MEAETIRVSSDFKPLTAQHTSLQRARYEQESGAGGIATKSCEDATNGRKSDPGQQSLQITIDER